MERVIRFLKENNIYGITVYNIRENQWSTLANAMRYRNIFNDILDGSFDARCFFSYAFEWRETVQGHYFWEEISEKWGTICVNFGIKKLKK